jgi:hypothetical protein
MKRKKLDQYQKAQNRALSNKEVYDLYHGQSLSWKEVCEKLATHVTLFSEFFVLLGQPPPEMTG